MPKFDISNAADFSRLTSGALNNLNALFGGRDPKEWDIAEGSYNGIKFHVFALSKSGTFDPRTGEETDADAKTVWEGAVNQITDYGGRRKVKYEFPYRDGQTTDDLGRKGESFELEIVIFGPRYMQGYTKLLNEFNKPQAGKLVHPVRGELDCVAEEWQQIHKSDQRKAVAIRVTFTEHNFTAGSIRQVDDASVKSALTAALETFKIIDRAIAKVEGAILLVRGIKNLINSYLAVHKAQQAATLTNMNQTFNNKGGSSDIPALLPVNLGGTGKATSTTGGLSPGVASTIVRNPDGTLGTVTTTEIATDSNFVVVRSVSDPFNGIPVETLNQQTVIAVAVTQITKEVQTLREQTTAIIATIEANGGALELYETVIELRQSAVLTQNVLEKGIASSNARLINYTIPRTMSLREAAFLNGISPERVQELSLLNTEILSVNYVEKGTVIRVPAA